MRDCSDCRELAIIGVQREILLLSYLPMLGLLRRLDRRLLLGFRKTSHRGFAECTEGR